MESDEEDAEEYDDSTSYLYNLYYKHKVATRQGKVREIEFFFKVRELSGNSAKCQGIWKFW